MKLSEAERSALELLKNAGGSFLVTKIPDKTLKDMFGQLDPGMGVYRKLEKKELLFFTEEEPMEDGFTFTEEVYITEEGLNACTKEAG